jgi:uncharacterized cupin superfamily protein
MSRPVVNIADLEMREQKHGPRFEARLGRVGAAIGTRRLGAQYIVVPPGKTAYPRHNHHNNEEMYILLEGTGEYRLGKDFWPVRAGDVLTAPAGGQETAHQLANTGAGELRYIIEYPDSDKWLVASGIPPGGGMMGASFVMQGRDRPLLDYWDGEDIGEDE